MSRNYKPTFRDSHELYGSVRQSPQKNNLIIILILIIDMLTLGQNVDYSGLVSPFIGTDAHGHTFPGAVAPFGMVQLSPDTRLTGWDGCSGYHYSDSIIYGFSHTHLSGTGVSDYGDILIMPASGEISLSDYNYRSTFKKTSERAAPGYYSVYLEKPKVKVELAASQRVGMHRYRFDNQTANHIVVDLKHRDQVIESSLVVESDNQISGMRRSKQWANNQVIYFWIEFSKPFFQFEWQNGTVRSAGPRDSTIGEDVKAAFSFDIHSGDELIVKVGVSSVDVDGARRNMGAEISHWSFSKIKDDTREAWNDELGKIEVLGGTQEQRRIFYSALYHCMISPNVWSDIDGRYRGIDGNIHYSNDYQQYTIFSLWDTYRTLHPLLAIIDQKRTLDFVQSFLSIYEQGGLLPVWELAANETYCMIGYHSVSVILDAWKKGIRGFDAHKALQAMKNSANQNHFGLDIYRRDGFISGDKEHESVSKTLEYAYDDWCIGTFALELKDQKTYESFMERAQSYKHIFDKQSGFMRPRINGSWKKPFSPTEVDFHFTEANSWQYSFYVPHDIYNLIKYHGGDSAFEHKIDELFETDQNVSGRNQVDITGLIGQYAHGNEPSHHMAYLYNYVGKPWKTQKRVRQILSELYTSQPDGLSGNEDCGQMSAWYVMSALGMYPVTPGNNEFVLSSPIFPKAILHLENGKDFIIEAEGAESGYDYIVAASLNGRDYTKNFLNYDDISEGGYIKFILQPEFSEDWGTQMDERPSSEILTKPITVTPFTNMPQKAFSDQLSVELGTLEANSTIMYRLKSNVKWSGWREYINSPIIIDRTSTLEAKSISDKGIESKIIRADYVKQSSEYTIDLRSNYHPQYGEGGKNSLIDGIRGSSNWKLGGWQGFQGEDLIAVIDLGKRKRFKEIGAGFFQDIRSWIWLPTSVEILTSNDGVVFTKLGEIKHEETTKDDIHLQRDLILGKKSKARYIKIIANNFGRIPEWHLGVGGEAYIFVDEIWVK